ncbi:MATE family efflux transporter [Massilia sp. TS11]|uniref:MATE family efflux transporter n=1 Tax=Massilia sp. TS11 TaxID=2908003 RepID=UPI001EDC5089|nr:MATE family efflux transporter [Massilia sp. TS11]MCG2584975.1 MATE family efflux transporter [Massilia sp. TS11]
MMTSLLRHVRALEPGFFRRFFALGWPISAQLMLASSLALVDVLMVAALGATAVAAVGLAGKFFFIVILMISGVASGGATLAAQYVGARDAAGVRRVLAISLVAGWLAALPFTLATAWMPQQIMGWFSDDVELVRLGAQFLRLSAPFHLLMATVAVIAAVLRVYGKATLPMLVGVLAVGLNTVLNYFLIFGHAGAPQLGVAGAALATLTAKCVECAVLIALIYYAKSPICLSLAEFRAAFRPDEVRRFLRQSVPLVLNEIVFAGGMFGFSVIYGHMGTVQLASTTLMGPIEGLSIDLFIGFTTAAAVMIATALGARDFAAAKRHALVLAAVVTGATLVFGLLMAALRTPILSLFGKVEPEVLALAHQLFFIVCFTLWLRLYNVVACVSILRSGGEVRYTLYVDMVVVWLLVLPLTAYTGLVLHWPLSWVFALAIGGEALCKAPAYTLRILQRRWLRSLVMHTPQTLAH